MRLGRVLPPRDSPAVHAVIPGYAPAAAFMGVGVLLSLLDFRSLVWIVIGVVLSVAAAWYPRYPLRWLLIVVLAAGHLANHSYLSVRFLLLLAGLHLLYVLAGLASALPWSSWMQPGVFLPSLRRFVTIQIPCQLAAVVALLLLAPSQAGHRPLTITAFSVIGGLAIAGVGIALFRHRAVPVGSQ